MTDDQILYAGTLAIALGMVIFRRRFKDSPPEGYFLASVSPQSDDRQLARGLPTPQQRECPEMTEKTILTIEHGQPR